MCLITPSAHNRNSINVGNYTHTSSDGSRKIPCMHGTIIHLEPCAPPLYVSFYKGSRFVSIYRLREEYEKEQEKILAKVGVEPKTFESQTPQSAILARRSNQLSYSAMAEAVVDIYKTRVFFTTFSQAHNLISTPHNIVLALHILLIHHTLPNVSTTNSSLGA